VRCAQCQHDNRPGAKFCEECGAPLERAERACANCGAELTSTAKFCSECAHPTTGPAHVRSQASDPPDVYTPRHLAERILTSKASLEGERKQITVLFADLKGSTELIASLDPEDARTLLDPVLTLMMEAVHHYEGTVSQVAGDGIMALFGAPLAHEDHAVRACYAALRMQDAMRRRTKELSGTQAATLQIRVGMNSGDVVVRSIGSDLRMDYTAVGQTTHLAARMEQLAAPGSIRLTPATLRLAAGFVRVNPLGRIPVKGFSELVEVFELADAGPARTRLESAALGGLTRFVGRDRELKQLRAALEQANLGHGQIFAVVGDPGVGKSRLCREFTSSRQLHGGRIMQSATVPYGKTTTYLPVIELLRGYFEIASRDDPEDIHEKVTRKVSTLGPELTSTIPALLALLDVAVAEEAWQALDPIQRRQRTFDAVKRLLLRESEFQPLVVVFEDLHWIDGETQALLNTLVESLPAARLLLLVSYRPEYQNVWGSKSYFRQLRMDTLTAEGAAELLDALLGIEPALDPLKQRLIHWTDANPLFLEESIRALVEMATLTGARGAYRLAQPLEQLKIPGTVQAILAARIDRLPPEIKRLLQAAAVIGKAARGPPGRRVPVRNAPFSRSRVHVQARSHARGGLSRFGPHAETRPARTYHGSHRAARSRSHCRASRAARSPR
jgi:class 3 adenylate cyclase